MSKIVKEKIDVLILSDIHLGDQMVRHAEILNLFRQYEAKRVILNGDILNGLKFQRLHSEHWKILSIFRQMSKTHEVIWVHGNHDADTTIISQLLGIRVVNKYLWEMAGKKFLAIHGHQFDRFLNNNFIISQIAFFIYNQLKRNIVGRFVLNYIKNNNQVWKRNSDGVANGATHLGILMNVDYVFCGHTHQIIEQEKNKIKYFNTGAWTESPSAYVVINGEDIKMRQV